MDTLVAREREFIAREEASLDFQEALLDAQQRAIDEQKAIIQARRRSLEDEISLAELQRRLVPETPRKRRRVTSDHMTHEEVCASVGLGPTQRGITLIPDGVYMQCQTENDVGYEDYITDDYGLYDFSKPRNMDVISTEKDLRPGTINHTLFMMVNENGPLPVRLAFGGKNKWKLTDNLFVTGFQSFDGILKMRLSEVKVPRMITLPRAAALEIEERTEDFK